MMRFASCKQHDLLPEFILARILSLLLSMMLPQMINFKISVCSIP